MEELMTTLFLFLVAVPCVFCAPYDEKSTELHSSRDSRFIFTIIQFSNDICFSPKNESGVCYSTAECSQKGEPMGSCAAGFGECCRVALGECGGDIRLNNTMVYSPQWPETYNQAMTCTYKVHFDEETEPPAGLCQLRFDYTAMDLVAPSSKGVCENDRLIFENDEKSTYFCGKAPTNYHWYVETVGTNSPHTFTITTDSTNYGRKYAIRVSYIPCAHGVPTKCGNYFTGTSGEFISYNYGNGYYIAGLEYSICFRKEKKHCTYTLKQQTTKQYIETRDTFRLPMGKGISLVAVSGIPGATNICKLSGTQRMALYNTIMICYYPDEMVSKNPDVPFQVTVGTKINGNSKFNSLGSRDKDSGFHFKWLANHCTIRDRKR